MTEKQSSEKTLNILELIHPNTYVKTNSNKQRTKNKEHGKNKLNHTI